MISKILNIEPLTGRRATKSELLSRIDPVALVHIAAHGVPGTVEIILSPNLTSLSESFLLTMKDILNSKLRARLVVWSCCHSGRGEVKAEGVVGIARAFLGAGARSVVVTLWAVDAKATKEFMKHFYKQLSEGQCVSKCLHQAMKNLRKSDDFKDLKCWAPFVLVGDDVKMNFSKIRWEYNLTQNYFKKLRQAERANCSTYRYFLLGDLSEAYRKTFFKIKFVFCFISK